MQISEKDLNFMEDILNNFYGEENLQIDLPFYYQNKEYLYNLLGNNFIIKEPISLTLSKEGKEKQYYSKENETARTLLLTVNYHVSECFPKTAINTTFKKNIFSYFSYKNIFNNKITETFQLETPTKILKFFPNEKAFKALHRILNELYNYIEDPKELEQMYEALRINHSQYLNTLKIEGQLVLSIHPLDFLTSSNNSYKWESCLRGPFGEHFGGALELLYSPFALVAYIEGNKPYNPIPQDSRTWNNKKWREFFLVSKDFITPVKGYPYESEELEKIILEKIKKLSKVKYFDTPVSDINFESAKMYNDLDNVYTKTYVSNLNYPKNITFSEKSQCVKCHCKENLTDSWLCGDCDPRPICDCCGNHAEELIYLDNEDICVCNNCYEENYFYCEACQKDIPAELCKYVCYRTETTIYESYICYECFKKFSDFLESDGINFRKNTSPEILKEIFDL